MRMAGLRHVAGLYARIVVPSPTPAFSLRLSARRVVGYAAMEEACKTLARRLGKTVHVSPLRMRLARLQEQFPCKGCATIEDWFVRVANARGARVVVPPSDDASSFVAPPECVFSNEELVVAICQANCLDRPQMLRLAAQLVSRGAVDTDRLRLVADRERAQPVLAELAKLALRIDPGHAVWQRIRALYVNIPPLHEPLLHWTRLAEPVMGRGRCNAEGWRLVA
jgi:hypothetical protein